MTADKRCTRLDPDGEQCTNRAPWQTRDCGSHTPKRYTTDGDVRGTCGHMHRTREAAARCLTRDQHACGRQGGYSDRQIVEVVQA